MTADLRKSIPAVSRNNSARWLWPIVLCLWLAGQLAIVESSKAAEAALSLIAIEIDGRAADLVSEVAIIAAGKDRAEKRTLRTGTVIEQGLEILVPPRTVLVLQSVNGNQARLQPGSRFKVNVVSGEGETYTLLLGQVFFKVGKALNFFNVNYQSFLAIVRGTEFDMAVEPEKEIRFQLIEGRLVVQREVKVRILDENKVAQLTASEVLAQGGKTQVSYRLGVEEYLQEFKTFKDAEEYFRQQLQEDEKSGEYQRIQQGLNDLGHILITVGKPKEATGYFELALKAAQKRQGQTWEAPLLNNLGLAYDGLGEYRSAIEYYYKALAIYLQIYPDGVDPGIAASYSNLGNAYDGLHDYRGAIEHYQKALKIRLKLHPDGMHAGVARIYNNLGVVYRRLGQPPKAIECYTEALTIQLKLYPDGSHPDIAATYTNIGNVCGDLRAYRLAIGYYEMALPIHLKLYPDGSHPDIAAIYTNLGNAYCQLREYRPAIAYYEKTLKIRLALYPDGVHPDIATSYNDLGNAYGAGDDYRKPVVSAQGLFTSWFTPKIQVYPLGKRPEAVGEFRTAIECYEKALNIRLKLYSDGVHADVLQCYRNLSWAWYLVGDKARWEEYDKKGDELEAKLKR